jgi:hypothetical protein
MAARRGRRPGFQMSAEHRGKIRTTSILNALGEHVEGKRKMSATQVSAGLGLLRKVMPDLAQIHGAGDDDKLVVVIRSFPNPFETPDSLPAARPSNVIEHQPVGPVYAADEIVALPPFLGSQKPQK